MPPTRLSAMHNHVRTAPHRTTPLAASASPLVPPRFALPQPAPAANSSSCRASWARLGSAHSPPPSQQQHERCLGNIRCCCSGSWINCCLTLGLARGTQPASQYPQDEILFFCSKPSPSDPPPWKERERKGKHSVWKQQQLPCQPAR